jgi:hypothetical protein
MMGKPTVFISSTSIDLPAHRRQVSEACGRIGFEPVHMAEWPAQDADAETVCLRKVDGAGLFLGVYTFLYGWVPPGHQVSITELEYDRAVDKGKPRLPFFMDENFELPARLIERGEGGAKLDAFKLRVGSEPVGFFTTPNDLRGLVIHALSEREKPEVTPREPLQSATPTAPELYIAHLYALILPAQIERVAGNTRAATEAATRAYELAWCDQTGIATLRPGRPRSHAGGGDRPAGYRLNTAIAVRA